MGKSIASYAAPIWSTNASYSNFNKIQTALKAALMTATRAHKMASNDHLHQQFLTLKVMDHSDMISAHYIMNCLDHVWHDITSQDPIPWPTKESIHSIHHSTVLHRLDTSGKESPEPAHTRSRSAIQLQGNNRALKDSPPPIADEEQRLNRKQICALSQLWSWHCHLLQDYKNMVVGKPSNICTDCGASPQYVIHLFACNAHPTDMTPDDLGYNPVESIREFSYLDDSTLKKLTTDLGMANSNNNANAKTSESMHAHVVKMAAQRTF